MDRLIISLPHTPRVLSPNASAPLSMRGAQVAGYKRAAAKKRAKLLAVVKTIRVMMGCSGFKPTHYRVVWYYKGVAPDADNCLARCKAYLDGCCAAFGIDDRVLNCVGIERVKSRDRGNDVDIVFERGKVRTCCECGLWDRVDGYCMAIMSGCHGEEMPGLNPACGDFRPKLEE